MGIWVINLWSSITGEHPAVRLMEVSRNWVLFTYKFSHFEKAHAEKTQACKVAYLESFYFPSLPVFCKHCYCSVFRLGLIYLWRYLWRLPLWNKVRFIYISVFRVCFRILWASFIWQDKTEKEPGLFVTLEISSPQKCPKAQPIWKRRTKLEHLHFPTSKLSTKLQCGTGIGQTYRTMEN